MNRLIANEKSNIDICRSCLQNVKKEPSGFAKKIMGVFDKKYLMQGGSNNNFKGEKKNLQKQVVVFPIPYSYY